MRKRLMMALLALTAPALAVAEHAGAPAFMQRDIHQQKRIQQGLSSGALTSREAARLQREQAAIDRLQARALADGRLTPTELARIEAAQDRASRNIYREKHDAQTGHPDSPSARRLQADIARNIRQEERIQQGLAVGELTEREAARLEAGQAHVGRLQAGAARDGHVGAAEQARIRHAQNEQSRRIFRQKHDSEHR
ncbi:MAG: hypothetical protein RMK97_06445 [Sutterellaceae bacterium]|nr:hypothetical protein [Burkholderiaceae bacterium]MCX7901498.1 hypothetical protein [Burkholderiaceae bacterium]MDW8430127.1 hypothetical protein [Sutterellaceae bacterium]